MRWLKRCFALIFWVMLAFALAAGSAWFLTSREAAPLTSVELLQHKQKAFQWLKNNESLALQDGNSALWWMLRVAAEKDRDPYLAVLVRKAVEKHYQNGRETLVWRRMVEPDAEITMDFAGLNQLQDYQAFYHHAMTCVPLPLKQGTTMRFLTENLCAQGV